MLSSPGRALAGCRAPECRPAGARALSTRGGPPGFVRRLDSRHIAIPDLNGNNRLDSYRNLVEHPDIEVAWEVVESLPVSEDIKKQKKDLA